MTKKKTKSKRKQFIQRAKRVLTQKHSLSRAHNSLILIALICALSILFVNFLDLNESLKHSIIAEIIGSGIVAGLISYFFFELQNANEYEANKKRAEEYYRKKALPDIQEVFDSGQSVSWIIDLGKEFYMSASLINPLYKAYEENLDVVIDYQSYHPNDVLLRSLDALYLLARKAYTQGEILDNALRRFIRIEHHKRSINQYNDGTMLRYLKARLFAGVPDEEVIQYLDWDTIPDRAKEMSDLASKSPHIAQSLEALQSFRQAALKLMEVVSALREVKDD